MDFLAFLYKSDEEEEKNETETKVSVYTVFKHRLSIRCETIEKYLCFSVIYTFHARSVSLCLLHLIVAQAGSVGGCGTAAAVTNID